MNTMQKTWLRKLFPAARPSHRKARDRHRFRPALHELESRLTPSGNALADVYLDGGEAATVETVALREGVGKAEPQPVAKLNFAPLPATGGLYTFRLRAVAHDGATFHPAQPFTCNGLSPTQMRDLVYDALVADQWAVARDGAFGLTIYAKIYPGTGQTGSAVKRVHLTNVVGLAGNQRPGIGGVNVQTSPEGQPKDLGGELLLLGPWEVSFFADGGAAAMGSDATVEIVLDGSVVSADVTEGMTPEEVTFAVYEALVNAGVDAVLSDGALSFATDDGLAVSEVWLAFTGPEGGPVAEWLGLGLVLPGGAAE